MCNTETSKSDLISIVIVSVLNKNYLALTTSRRIGTEYTEITVIDARFHRMTRGLDNIQNPFHILRLIVHLTVDLRIGQRPIIP